MLERSLRESVNALTQFFVGDDTAPEIDQAQYGILMAAQGGDEDEAFELLVRASQRENVKLREVAVRIVDTAIERARQRPR